MRSFFFNQEGVDFQDETNFFFLIFYNFISFALVIIDYKVDVPFYTPACKDKES